MPNRVFLTEDAGKDLEGLYEYIFRHDGPEKADYVLERIEAAFENLAANPNRGARPNELLDLGIREYREVFFKPYRIIYRVIDEDVYVVLIVDGRRDMQSLLQRRLVQT
jgi:toxin ParE1/3/4